MNEFKWIVLVEEKCSEKQEMINHFYRDLSSSVSSNTQANANEPFPDFLDSISFLMKIRK